MGSDVRAGGVVVLGLLTACVLPTDKSDALAARFPIPQVLVRVGDTVRVTAEAVAGETVRPGVALAYESLDPETAVVSNDGVLLGVGEGETAVVARVVTYENGGTDTLTVFVSRGIFIRGVTPEVSQPGTGVRFGETIELIGLRLAPESLSVVTIDARPARVMGYAARDTADPASFERLRLRVPVAPPASELLLVHRGGGSATRTLDINQEDVFEIRGTPPVIDLAGGDYLNDALTATASDPDLLRFVLPAGDHTLTATVLDGRLLVEGEPELRFLAPQVFEYVDGFESGYVSSDIPDNWAWSVENRGISCDLRTIVYYLTGFFNSPRGPGNVVTLALRNAAPDTVDFIAATVGTRIRYKLEARAGYHTALPADALEENDACDAATPVTPSPTAIDLNFDNATDFDWFEITVAPASPVPTFAVTARAEQEPNDSLATAEVVTFGSRVLGIRDVADDIDVYAFDAVAGTLVDIDVLAYRAADAYRRFDCPDRCSQGVVPWAPANSTLISDLSNIDLRLYDSVGVEIARAQNGPVLAHDGRLRHLVTTSGRYYVSMEGRGTRGNPVGVEQYYAIDFFAHEQPTELRIAVEGTDGLVDPRIWVVERRTGENLSFAVANQPGVLETYVEAVHPGSYLVMVFETSGRTGPYRLVVEEAAVVVPPLRNR